MYYIKCLKFLLLFTGNHSKITLNTKNVFIECTGTDFTKVKQMFNFYTVRQYNFTFGPRLILKFIMLKEVGTYYQNLEN